MLELFFILSVLLTVYSYALFPLLLWTLKWFMHRPWQKASHPLSVSIIISVYNEERVIKAKLQNAIALKYPPEQLEIIVCSDGSTDQTHAFVESFADPRIVLRRFERLGKTECLNRVMPNTRGDIILFTDANSMFPSDLLNQLVTNFADRDVGLVTGWTKYMSPGGGEEVTGLYAKLEKYTKYWESLISSCVGADGAIFAIRKELYQPLRTDDINDFIIPLHVIQQGKRVVLDPDVFCQEDAADSDQKAFRRQIRITTRTLWAIRRHLYFLNFSKYKLFAFFLLSHKVLRLATPFFFAVAFFLNFPLLGVSWFFNLTFAGYLIFFALGLTGLTGLFHNKIASICKFFLITFNAQLLGWLRMAIGIHDKTWTPQR